MKRILAGIALAAFAVPALAQTASPAPEVPAGSIMGPALHVLDVERALKFYTQGLGMTVNMTMGPEAHREIILGFGRDPSKPGLILLHDSGPDVPKAIVHGYGFSRVILRMADLDATAARLRAAGFEPGEIKQVAMGYRMMLVTDPDGYALELVQSPARPKE